MLDVDGPEGAASFVALEQAHGPLPSTLESVTPNGRHLFFAWPGKRVPTSQGRLGPKLDIRGDGGCCMVPPSIHPSKQRYRWVDEKAHNAPAPDWLVTLATKEKERTLPVPARDRQLGDWSLPDVQSMLSALSPDMQRDEWLRVGMALHSGGLPFEVWDGWSRPGKTYDSRGTVSQWRSFKDAPGGVRWGRSCTWRSWRDGGGIEPDGPREAAGRRCPRR